MDESEIDIESVGDGIAIHLPDRKLGDAKKAGWVIVGMAAVGMLFMLCWILTPVSMGVGLIRKGEMFGWLFVAFGSLGLGGLYAAGKFLSLGVAVLRDKTRCTITVTDEKIVAREKFGWFSYKRQMDREEIEQLFIMPVGSIRGSRDVNKDNRTSLKVLESFFGDVSDFYAITNRKRDGDMMAAGYSREILDSAAAAIAEELNRNSVESVLIVREPSGTTANDTGNPGPVTVQNLSREEVDRSDFELPEDSTLEVIEEGDSIVYRIPERTLTKGSNGMFMFSIFWNGFMVIFTASFLFGNGLDLAAMSFMLFFWAIGIAMLVGAVYMARQSALIGVKDGLLFVERKTIFGEKWTEFSAEQIESIEMGRSNMEVNDVPVMNLQIKPHDEKLIGMFSQLDNAELEWLAQQLRRALGIESRAASFSVANFDPAAPIEELVSTDIEVQKKPAQTTITVPPYRFKGSRSLWAIGLAFMVFPIPAGIALNLIDGFDLMILIFATLFASFGAVMFFGHRMIATRNYLITATEQHLDVEVHGFMPCGGVSATRQEILSVDVVDTGTKLNNESMHCVKIRLSNGKGMSMMTSRDRKELIYVARLIHQQLRLDPPGSTSD